MSRHPDDTVEYLRHELLDRVSAMGDVLDVVVRSHAALGPESPKCFREVDRQHILKKLEKASRALSNVYQHIAKIHL